MEQTLYKVYVYPDGSNFSSVPMWMSDDYEVRYTTMCEYCSHVFELDYDKPIAYCACGPCEWTELSPGSIVGDAADL